MSVMKSDGSGKPALRKTMAARRDALTSEERTDRSRRLSEVVISNALRPLSRELGRPLTVAVYGAFRSEADPSAVFEWCVAEGHRAVAPRIRDDGSGMELRIVSSLADWQTGRFGAPSPDPLRTKTLPLGERPDVVLVPGLAFDRQGGRLGYGGGYYDRLAEAIGPGRLPYWIGFAYSLQVIDETLPKETHDLALHGLATEQEWIWLAEEGQ